MDIVIGGGLAIGRMKGKHKGGGDYGGGMGGMGRGMPGRGMGGGGMGADGQVLASPVRLRFEGLPDSDRAAHRSASSPGVTP